MLSTGICRKGLQKRISVAYNQSGNKCIIKIRGADKGQRNKELEY